MAFEPFSSKLSTFFITKIQNAGVYRCAQFSRSHKGLDFVEPRLLGCQFAEHGVRWQLVQVPHNLHEHHIGIGGRSDRLRCNGGPQQAMSPIVCATFMASVFSAEIQSGDIGVVPMPTRQGDQLSNGILVLPPICGKFDGTVADLI